MLRISFIVVAGLILSHCGTVSPDVIQAHGASIGSDGLQDSGIKGIVEDLKTHQRFFVISSEDRDNYNSMIARYGNEPSVKDRPMHKDQGLRPYGKFYAIDSRHWQDWTWMLELSRADAYVRGSK